MSILNTLAGGADILNLVFTGIVEAVGRVAGWDEMALLVDAPPEFGDDFDLGESISVNGCCLTVVAISPLRFDLSPETLNRTALGSVQTGDRLNLERAMLAKTRFGGHLVQGHVDAVGKVAEIRQEANSVRMRFAGPPDYDRYLIDKGSITVDGISLTVVEPGEGAFDVWVIPHTLENTRLGDLKVGDSVNLEYDMVAKYVEKMVRPYSPLGA